MGALGCFSAAFLAVSPGMRNQIRPIPGQHKFRSNQKPISYLVVFAYFFPSHERLSVRLEIAIVSGRTSGELK